jgi:pyrroloquinoline-quinone synthase
MVAEALHAPRYHPAMDLSQSVTDALAGRMLLSHPFYRRWEAGDLAAGELAAYAAQYLHVERQLPETLEAVIASADNVEVRANLQENLDDERGRPMAHVELFSGFADAVGATPASATPATAELVALYARATDEGTAFAIGVLAAYELQAADVARSKAEGLRAHYGLSESAIAFWDLHATMEVDHAGWTIEAAAELDGIEFLRGVAASRDAWWSFLDERELAAQR